MVDQDALWAIPEGPGSFRSMGGIKNLIKNARYGHHNTRTRPLSTVALQFRQEATRGSGDPELKHLRRNYENSSSHESHRSEPRQKSRSTLQLTDLVDRTAFSKDFADSYSSRSTTIPKTRIRLSKMKSTSSAQQRQGKVAPQEDEEEVLESPNWASNAVYGCQAGHARKSSTGFDIVAVGFSLAQLQSGCLLTKLKANGESGRLTKFFVKVESDGAVSMKMVGQGLVWGRGKTVQILSTEAKDAETLEVRLVTSVGEFIVQAPTQDIFVLWTEGMSSVFSYARAFAMRKRLELRKLGRQGR